MLSLHGILVNANSRQNWS